MMSDDDPFDCFGGDDVDVEEETAVANTSVDEARRFEQRDPSNGILAFHAGTEQALLHYVKQEMLKETVSGAQENDKAAAVLRHVDDFSLRRHWMMHVGYGKGPIIEEFLTECFQAHKALEQPLIVLEIGTYCGYSSILMAKTLRHLGCGFRILSVEVVAQNAQVAKKMVELAGLKEDVEILLLDPEKDSLEALLRRNMESDNVIDFLFLDHDKTLYLSDLQQLEKCGFVKRGCFVAADNVIFAQIDDYRQYVADLEKKKIVRTKLAMSFLEYSEPDHHGDEQKKNMMRDGVGESVIMHSCLHFGL